MTSQRAVLGGLGSACVMGLAGCSLPFEGEEKTNESVRLPSEAVPRLEWPPSPFPGGVPDSVFAVHRERARALLADVPEEPDVPNGAVAAELSEQREGAAGRLDEAMSDPWPTDALSTWRGRRAAAATVRGAYRAAVGEDDADGVVERRAEMREGLAGFEAGRRYEAASPLEAVLVYAPIEELLVEGERSVRPQPAYPSDPVRDPFRAGDMVGQLERARALLGDERRLRETHLAERSEASSQWGGLIDTSDRLRFAVTQEHSSVRPFLDADEPPFDTDLEGTAAQWLFESARRRVESAIEDHERARERTTSGTAVIETGRALAAIEVLRTTIEGIREGAYQADVSVESVQGTAERAREAIHAIEESTDGRLARVIGRPALDQYRYIPDRIEEGYGEAPRVQANLAWVELYARAVPAVTEFVLARL